ncbi:tryptophan synthase subunit beta [Candidatus Fermentibacteria bacterium]|nr:tryptophan synthase subunit beta [Candidatus Fermentibacteria bacterium]
MPDLDGWFGRYGGRFVPETLLPALRELDRELERAMGDPKFEEKLDSLLGDFVGRPTPMFEAVGFSESISGPRVFLKREDLAHTGAHKINNSLGQTLLARRMGRRRVVAETGAGQHGVSAAAAAALLGLDCVVFMGSRDMERQAPNVTRMELLGAEVRPVRRGRSSLKEAITEAIRFWITNVEDTHYLIGSVVGPHPYPKMVRHFQSVIGRESRNQLLRKLGRLPDLLVACVGAGSNSLGFFHRFLKDSVRMVGVEAAGRGLETGEHGASLSRGRRGVLHGSMSYVLQDGVGQITEAHSVAPGLDYPAVGPEHSHLRDTGRVEYDSVDDSEALEAFDLLARTEGILPALESSHALAWVMRNATTLGRDTVLSLCLSGRGDKDIDQVESMRGGPS